MNFKKNKVFSNFNQLFGIISIVIIWTIFISCSTKILKSNFNSFSQPNTNFVDYKQRDCKNIIPLRLKIENNLMQNETNLRKTKTYVLPLLFFYNIKKEWEVELGQKYFALNYKDDFTNCLNNEFLKTRCLEINNSVSENNNYELRIRFDTCRTIAKYQEHSIAILTSFSFSYQGFSAISNISIEVSLLKNNHIMYNKSYSVKKILPMPFKQTSYNSIVEYNKVFIQNMVDAFTITSNSCIGEIVNDIEVYLKSNQ